MTATIWSTYGYRITSPYGWRSDPFTGNRTWHTGIDLVKSHQAPILSFTDGTVLHARMGITGSGFGGFGNVVAIQANDGALLCYAHLDNITVQTGQVVKTGQKIGTQGSTGRSTGSHLHFEVRRQTTPSFGFKTDTHPETYLLKTMKTETTTKPIPISIQNKFICNGTYLDGMTYAPLRLLGERLGANITWNGVSAAVNGKHVSEAKMKDGQLYVPVRIFEQLLHIKVNWTGKEIYITT
ncbi:peptidoglycan DD-metalloendopeptidase family protein [Paenibacillus sp. ACRRX]|uniref:peptidoglycan DD-metalloendopeptidase family protein n=1 Tax=Paenibacillus sp. ACRRX TaxID=2918206 RepID=UPI001EF4C28E|nr:peptidoglycan DD-metalloendopeptidase family protein [Paenibacillus sp. ACRRX]MCG7406369.1 peptidoglycan DD-metalloendopeptidase family protein [Paenibacillus sp. ACRRX]